MPLFMFLSGLDVCSVIKPSCWNLNKLGKKLDNVSGDSYTVNGVTYDDGSNVAQTVKALTREIKVRRRM